MRSLSSEQIWHEVSARFHQNRAGAEDCLRAFFYRFGFDETSVSAVVEGQYGYLKVYCASGRDANRLTRQLAGLNLKGVKVTQTALDVTDWRDKWKEAIRPFHLTQRFDVIPVWCAEDESVRRREPLYLDTTLSFGTGLHETTRFMARLIESRAGAFEIFLDIGTGTGLLSIVANRCGAKVLWAVDIDAGSIQTAAQNLDRNHLQFDWCRAMDFKTFSSRRTFDFVAANVITDELILMKKKIISAVAPGKYLAVSGISLENIARFRREFEDERLKCLRLLKGRKWAAILYKKKS